MPQSLVIAAGIGTVPPTGGPGERHLLAALERAARATQRWSATVLHLSRLTPPAPLPHHRRIAHALMQDAAERADGQVFALRNADVVLLARDAEQAIQPVPSAFAERLRGLFGRDAGHAAAIVSEWRLPCDTAALAAYAADRLAEPEATQADEAVLPPAELVDAVAAAIAGARPQDIVRRQTAVRLDPAGSGPAAAMRPCFRELTFSLDALGARLPASLRIEQDPALRLHLGRYLDRRMFQVLQLEQRSASPLDISAQTVGTLHLNLTLPGVLSEGLTALAKQCRAVGTKLGVEVSLVEAVADPAAFVCAGARLRDLGATLVLDGVSHLAMMLAKPASLPADLLKLTWSPCMATLPDDEQAYLAEAVSASDPARIVLQHAVSETAVRWGLAHGIRLFQGRHIDQMLAAQRMLACPAAAGCSPAQCVARAASTGPVGRIGCTNPALLDAGRPVGPVTGVAP